MISPRLFHGWQRIAKTGLAALTLSIAALHAGAQEAPEVVEMKPPAGMELANILIVKTDPNPVGVIVLLSGHNASPEHLLADPKWQELATKHRYGLIGCYFKNDMTAKSGFYQYPAHGAGKILTDAVRKIYKKDLPMAIYGFSAGAQFTARFAALSPRSVKVFATYAPGSVDTVRPTPQLPPGAVLCGANDERHDKVERFFNEGRANAFRWVWLSVPNTTHKTSPAAIDFIRSYFDGVLSTPGTPTGVWMNQTDGTLGSGSTRKPTFGWLPNAKLVEPWKVATGK